MLKRLAAFPRQNGLAMALREVGMDLADARGRMRAFQSDLTIAPECNFWRTRRALFGGRSSDRDDDYHWVLCLGGGFCPTLRDPLTLYER
jgi:hypothetical protein